MSIIFLAWTTMLIISFCHIKNSVVPKVPRFVAKYFICKRNWHNETCAHVLITLLSRVLSLKYFKFLTKYVTKCSVIFIFYFDELTNITFTFIIVYFSTTIFLCVKRPYSGALGEIIFARASRVELSKKIKLTRGKTRDDLGSILSIALRVIIRSNDYKNRFIYWIWLVTCRTTDKQIYNMLERDS